MLDMIGEGLSALATVETGGAATLAAGAIGIAIKLVQKRLDRHDATGREERALRDAFMVDLTDAIDERLDLSRSSLYGVFSNTLTDWSELRSAEKGKAITHVKYLRKSVEIVDSMKEFRKSFDNETKDIYSWFKSQIIKNIKRYKYDDYSLDILEDKIKQHSELIRGHLATRISKEVGQQEVVTAVLDDYLTYNEIHGIYRAVIYDYIELEAELQADIKKIDEMAIISPRKRKKKGK